MKYLWLTLRHKWFVLLAGRRTRTTIWRRIRHDLSKLLPCELPHYQRQFFGAADNPLGYIGCWTHHQNANDHHWEYWIPRTGHSRCNPPFVDNEPIPMPEEAVREMVADWLASGRAYGGHWPDVNNWTWYRTNRSRMRIHPATERLIDIVIRELQAAAKTP
jgi:hypothetical protein